MPSETPSERLDLALVARGLTESRSRARHLIESGEVTVDGVVVTKSAAKVAPEQVLALAETAHSWASRAALKLVGALDLFSIDPAGQICLDIGASTGGFTDVLLARGAARVHAVDVGHGQLVRRLREDPRVTVYEHLNIRDLTPAQLGEPVGLIVSDVSFISLKLALPAALACASEGATLVALVKPQFEVGPGRVGKGGIVRDEAVRREALDGIVGWLEQEAEWTVVGTADALISGSDGNQEYLIAARKPC
ncbi:TlyA family RNA methyltransferase [Nisaea acidiphila]|uniref:TlyA family RNA methyltransferase n=1 Tax=Nisaea acidiphila TaxID=1862145 RepID=A0A9J7AVA9_9PROT|nr:TlyA family RNA methyltransferase [Nisaea acidiphila]UUX50738.1 TlyA family RNA methyltransferase [Nisaea acidiphila]